MHIFHVIYPFKLGIDAARIGGREMINCFIATFTGYDYIRKYVWSYYTSDFSIWVSIIYPSFLDWENVLFLLLLLLTTKQQFATSIFRVCVALISISNKYTVLNISLSDCRHEIVSYITYHRNRILWHNY